jgi:hypothetical protein
VAENATVAGHVEQIEALHIVASLVADAACSFAFAS